MRMTSHQGGLSEDGHFKVVFISVISLHGGLYEGHLSSGCFFVKAFPHQGGLYEGEFSPEWSL